MVSSLGLADSGPVIHNLVISNVPGPPVPLFFMGAKIEGLYPLGPIFHGAGLNITVMSSESQMHVGAIGCRELVPQPWKLTEKFPEELEALYDATVGQEKKPAKKASAKKTPENKSSIKKTATKKSTTKKSGDKKTASKKTASKKTASKKTAQAG
jgi:diacylglycerol O-acyltransferase